MTNLPDNDPAVREINARRRAGEPVSFAWLRERYKADDVPQDALGRGRAILGSTAELNRYLWSHGLMVADQWRHAARFLPAVTAPVRWIDHGCGQGLASLLIRDVLGGAVGELVTEVVLVEPSRPALARAGALYAYVAPNAVIRSANRAFDDVTADELRTSAGLDTMHLFSNVLDIEGVDFATYSRKALGPGRHMLLAVSNDRDTAGGTPLLLAIRAWLEGPTMRHALQLRRSFFELLPSRFPGVLWVCELEVHRG